MPATNPKNSPLIPPRLFRGKAMSASITPTASTNGTTIRRMVAHTGVSPSGICISGSRICVCTASETAYLEEMDTTATTKTMRITCSIIGSAPSCMTL